MCCQTQMSFNVLWFCCVFNKGAVKRYPGPVFGASLERLWGVLGASLGRHLGRFGHLYEKILERPWVSLGASGASLGRHLGRLEVSLGAFWSVNWGFFVTFQVTLCSYYLCSFRKKVLDPNGPYISRAKTLTWKCLKIISQKWAAFEFGNI